MAFVIIPIILIAFYNEFIRNKEKNRDIPETHNDPKVDKRYAVATKFLQSALILNILYWISFLTAVWFVEIEFFIVIIYLVGFISLVSIIIAFGVEPLDSTEDDAVCKSEHKFDLYFTLVLLCLCVVCVFIFFILKYDRNMR
ncbi:MAG: hypothetical protein IJF54_01055 [Clostridia bacterium]|nr:hypothetical protein [Clostridia bacterium]